MSSLGTINWADPTIIAAFIAVIAGGIGFWLKGMLDKRAIRREQQRQQQEEQEAKRQQEQLRAKTLSRHVQDYCECLRNDPHLVNLQILGMRHPLDIMSIHVKLRLYEEKVSNYELDPILQAADEQQTPEDLLQVVQQSLEIRARHALDPDDAVSRYRRCVIMGDPGAGKSTLLKYLLFQTLEGRLPGLPTLPIHIELNAFATSGEGDLLNFAAITWHRRYHFPQDEAHTYIKTQLSTGSALLLLDGLDETLVGTNEKEAEQSYSRALNAIMEVVDGYHLAPIVVTVRKAWLPEPESRQINRFSRIRSSGFPACGHPFLYQKMVRCLR